jgi:hypothetical protein
MLSSLLCSVLNVPLCWLLVLKSPLANKGADMALPISYWFNTILLALYIKYSPTCKETWTGFSRDAFHHVPQFLKLAVSSALMIWWVLSILASRYINVSQFLYRFLFIFLLSDLKILLIKFKILGVGASSASFWYSARPKTRNFCILDHVGFVISFLLKTTQNCPDFTYTGILGSHRRNTSSIVTMISVGLSTSAR